MSDRKCTLTFRIIIVAIVLLLTVGIIYGVGRSFGFFKYIKKGEIVNIITIGNISDGNIKIEVLNTGNNALNLENAYPVYDSEGLESTPFEFTVTNTTSNTYKYQISVLNDEEKQSSCVLDDGTTCPELTTNYIRFAYKKNDGNYSEPASLSELNDIVLTDTIGVNEEIKYSIILWIDSEAGNEIMNHYFFGKMIISEIGAPYLANAILDDNKLIEAKPTLTTSSNNTNDASGLYKSTDTNSGEPTYYFRGNVENNYVEFAGYTWRIVRINEDGTVRLLMTEGINDNALYSFNDANVNDIKYMYYSNSNVKKILESWYTTNIANSIYSNYIVNGNYYCEQAKVLQDSTYTSGNASMKLYSSYVPNFKCSTDGNGYGFVNSSVGLLSYDEIVFSGGYSGSNNDNYYLYNSEYHHWIMSPSGYTPQNCPTTWLISTYGSLGYGYQLGVHLLLPVINLKADTVVTGSGTSDSPYVVVVEEPRNLAQAIIDNNTLITAEPTLDTTSSLSGDASGLYKSTDTNSGEPTYYFRGNVENNYVEFAGYTWRIVRINEDGTIRLIMQNGINDNKKYVYASDWTGYNYLYYSNNSVAKTELETWYINNISNNVAYLDRLSTGDYYCEQAKVKGSADFPDTNMVSYNEYTPNFKCSSDSNNKGIVNSNIGLIGYDEVIYAGGYFNVANDTYFLNNNINFWTMSPSGLSQNYALIWQIRKGTTLSYGYSSDSNVNIVSTIRPVINLKADTVVTGSGTSEDPYVVVTNT